MQKSRLREKEGVISTLVCFEHVQRWAGSELFLDIPSLQAAENDSVAILSENPEKNRDVLRMIAGLRHPECGQVFLFGELIQKRSPPNPLVTLVLSAESPQRDKSLFEQLMNKVRTTHGFSEPKAVVRLKFVAKHLKLTSMLEDNTYYCNQDELVRIALAAAFIQDSAIVLLDDLISFLPERRRHVVISALNNLRLQLNKTLVFATTSPSDSLLLADKIVVMNNGKVEQVGSPSEIYCRPSSYFVANFVGYPKINIMSIREIDYSLGMMSCLLYPDYQVYIEKAGLNPKDHPLFLGVRPDGLHIGSNIPVIVERVEYYNGGTFIYVVEKVRKYRLSFAERGFKYYEQGTRLALDINPKQAYLFDSSLKLISGI